MCVEDAGLTCVYVSVCVIVCACMYEESMYV